MKIFHGNENKTEVVVINTVVVFMIIVDRFPVLTFEV
jgi:hypothetical protein